MTLKETGKSAEFLGVVQRCEGEVFFDTPSGDHLNLKSELSQLVFTVIINKLEGLDYSITFGEEDRIMLSGYLEERNGA